MATESLRRQRSFPVGEKDFENLIEENLPSWTATWNLLLQANLERSRLARRSGRKSSTELHKAIRQKITELVDKEEALVDLYTKAAEAAKARELKFRNKTAILREQIKKDKNLMRFLKHAN